MKNDSRKIAELLLGYMLLATVITGNTQLTQTSGLPQKETCQTHMTASSTSVNEVLSSDNS